MSIKHIFIKPAWCLAQPQAITKHLPHSLTNQSRLGISGGGSLKKQELKRGREKVAKGATAVHSMRKTTWLLNFFFFYFFVRGG